jgi:hypothetical protein
MPAKAELPTLAASPTDPWGSEWEARWARLRARRSGEGGQPAPAPGRPVSVAARSVLPSIHPATPGRAPPKWRTRNPPSGNDPYELRKRLTFEQAEGVQEAAIRTGPRRLELPSFSTQRRVRMNIHKNARRCVERICAVGAGRRCFQSPCGAQIWRVSQDRGALCRALPGRGPGGLDRSLIPSPCHAGH